jgi:hypothetical protein
MSAVQTLKPSCLLSNMLNDKITLLAICLALLIASVGGNQLARNATIEVANISTYPLSSIPGVPLPESSLQTVRVRLMEVETNADVVDWPSPGSKIIIKAGATTLNKKN